MLVEYSSGGVTPGDTYLWILDDDGLPHSWKMWVKIIPIGGIEFSWNEWKTLSTGARVALHHDHKLLKINLSDVKAGMTWKDMDVDKDLFERLQENHK